MNQWRVGGLSTLVLVVASCGSLTPTPTTHVQTSNSPASTATPAPTPTPTPAGPLAACVSAPAGGTPAAWGFGVIKGSEIEVLSTGGTVLNKTSLVGVGDTVPVWVGVGQAEVYLYTKSTGELSVLDRSGVAQNLGTVTPTGGWNDTDNISLAESPSGTCWAFSVNSYDANAVATSELYVGGTGIAPTLLATLTRANMLNGVDAGGYQLLRWDTLGVLLGSDPTEVGGAGPFITESYSFGVVVRIDPQTKAVSAPLCGSGRFADQAPDGTVACITGLNSDAKIEVTKPGGSTTTIDTRSESAGEVAFVGGSSLLTYCTSAAGNDTWTETLLSVQLSGSSPSPTTVIPSAGPGLLDGVFAWYRLMATNAIAELQGTYPSTSLVEVNLSTGSTATIAAADSLLGVL